MATMDQPETIDLVVTRDVAVTPARAWAAWQDADDVRQWWGPDGFTVPHVVMDQREGGSSVVSMQGPDGVVLYNTWTYSRLQPHERIEFVLRFADRDGSPLDPVTLGLPPDIPADGVPHVVTFTPLDAGTRVTVTELGYRPGPVFEMSRQGQEQVMDKYAALLGVLR